jgi:hypothetical protein
VPPHDAGMKRYLLAGAAATLLAGCGSNLQAAGISEPYATEDDSGGETIWWADYRAHERGDNVVHVTSCRRRSDRRAYCSRTRVR